MRDQGGRGLIRDLPPEKIRDEGAGVSLYPLVFHSPAVQQYWVNDVIPKLGKVAHWCTRGVPKPKPFNKDILIPSESHIGAQEGSTLVHKRGAHFGVVTQSTTQLGRSLLIRSICRFKNFTAGLGVFYSTVHHGQLSDIQFQNFNKTVFKIIR